MNVRVLSALFAALVSAVLLAGCGSASGAPHNDADIAFVQGMIPHHTQAVEMARLVDGRAASPGVTELAGQIEAGQQPEIDRMRGFLDSWDVKENAPGDMSGMTGMMAPQQMQQLQAAAGAEFDRRFLQMMTEHHTGAIQMAETELARGSNADAQALAREIIAAQRGEITRMQQLMTTV